MAKGIPRVLRLSGSSRRALHHLRKGKGFSYHLLRSHAIGRAILECHFRIAERSDMGCVPWSRTGPAYSCRQVQLRSVERRSL